MKTNSKLFALENWFAIDNILFGGDPREVLSESEYENYMLTKACLMSNLVEIYKELDFEAISLSESSNDAEEISNYLAEDSSQRATEYLLTEEASEHLTLEVENFILENVDVDVYDVKRFFAENQLKSTSIDCLLLEETISEACPLCLQESEVEVLLETHSTLRNELVELAMIALDEAKEGNASHGDVANVHTYALDDQDQIATTVDDAKKYKVDRKEVIIDEIDEDDDDTLEGRVPTESPRKKADLDESINFWMEKLDTCKTEKCTELVESKIDELLEFGSADSMNRAIIRNRRSKTAVGRGINRLAQGKDYAMKNRGKTAAAAGVAAGTLTAAEIARRKLKARRARKLAQQQQQQQQ